MWIRTLELTNWERFKGTHNLELEQKAYSIVARREANPEHSNWTGKSSIPRAIKFALFGEHDHRHEDGWITHGEKEGQVLLILSDDTVITRSRKLGKSTRLSVAMPTDQGLDAAAGNDAQALLERIIGLHLRDYAATCDFEQGEVDRLIKAKPEERMVIVSEWLQLGALEKAAEFNAGKMAAVRERLDLQLGARSTHQKREEALLEGKSDEEIAAGREAARDARAKARIALAEAQAKVDEATKRHYAGARSAEYQELVAEGKALAKVVDDTDGEALEAELRELQGKYDGAAGELGAARREHSVKLDLATGGFDGRCPVAGIACPAKDVINGMSQKNRGEEERARKMLRVFEDAAGALKVDVREAEERVRTDHMNLAKLDELRERVRRLVGEGVTGEATRVSVEGVKQASDHLDACREALTAAERGDALYGHRLELIVNERKEAQEMRQRIAETEATLGTLGEAGLILGRSGAQRRVAEPFLGAIGIGANDALQECGVGLGVEVKWAHEGKDPAKSCGACGWPFPDSRKVKACQRCGTDRGMNVINRLEFQLSDTSGAAKDLAGVALQLSAAAWLRSARGVSWEVACLDEPLAQCDRAHRRSMTRAFATMLNGRFGFAQAFVVSHSPDTQAALPGTILVTGDDTSSRVEVVA